ncbi:ribosomal L28e protein family-domain-containing protein [Sordaria brevicollis]|uniref:Ribosomal L28e protein family-domain-containing protein n=1 Tax=Sordaria brevicollis TaxID=83679 RepID=A0AAE0UEU1_SORBR|nr:ribosomal L28e protein family-domain-containing protein [Sordaria brevicollis]
MSLSNVSADLIWEITRSQNSYLVKRTQSGGVQFSRDPLNLTNKHARKYAGFVNDKAVGVVAGEKGGVVVTTKKAGSITKPSARYTVAFGANKTARKTYKAIARQVGKTGYRADLLQAAVARASAIRRSQRPVKPEPAQKLRGNAAEKAASA